jgi:hypothetical protein
MVPGTAPGASRVRFQLTIDDGQRRRTPNQKFLLLFCDLARWIEFSGSAYASVYLKTYISKVDPS